MSCKDFNKKCGEHNHCDEDVVDMCECCSASDKHLHDMGQDFGYPGWLELSEEEKIFLIESVLDEHVRPYVEFDGGSVEVKKLIDGRELIINYKGSCCSCSSALCSTLYMIQDVLHMYVSPNLTVITEGFSQS